MTSGVTPPYVRRAPFLMLHWESGGAVVENYATGTSARATPSAYAILDAAARWTSMQDLETRLGNLSSGILQETVSELVDGTLLEVARHPVRERERALDRWEGWNPAAGYFHMATRDVAYVDPREVEPGPFVLRSYPPHLKEYAEGPSIDLPDYARSGALPRTLLERRTWRSFGEGGLTLDQLSTLLGLTWGVQMWVPVGGGLHAPLKTSPSGGAKHSGEAYVLIRDVEGMEDGTYHYHPDRHALVALEAETSPDLLERFIPGQSWFHRPPVVVFLTSVFERVHYKYTHARAYRVVLLESGHLAQTFCLVATWLGLAPFCTAALADTAIETHLAIDGVDESVLYAVGAGRRPESMDWALEDHMGPLEDMVPPVHAGRRGG